MQIDTHKWPHLLLLCLLSFAALAKEETSTLLLDCPAAMDWVRFQETALTLIASSPRELAKLKERRDWKFDPDAAFMKPEPPAVNEDGEFIIKALYHLSESPQSPAHTERFVRHLLSEADVQLFREAILLGTDSGRIERMGFGTAHQRRHAVRRILTALRIGQLFTSGDHIFRTRLHLRLQQYRYTRAQRIDRGLMNQIMIFYSVCDEPRRASSKGAALLHLRRYGTSTALPKIELLLQTILHEAQKD